MKVGVVRRESDQQHGKLGKDRTASKDSQDQSLSLVGFYHLNSVARSKATAIFDETMVEVDKGQTGPSVVNAKGEYRFSWLLQALNAEGISQGNGDVGSVAEMNYGKNEEDITTLPGGRIILEKKGRLYVCFRKYKVPFVRKEKH